MPIQEMINFRQKYPMYNNLDDITVATKLANKYPAYASLPGKVQMDLNKSNPQMQGGANAPALVKARQGVEQATEKTNRLDPLIVGATAANQYFGDIPRMAMGNKFPQATSTPGRFASDVAGLSAGIASPVYQVAGRALGAAGKAIGKFIPETIKRGAADYLTNTVAPQAHKIFQDAVAKFTPQIEQFARGKKIPESAIQAIKKYGTQGIEQARDSLGQFDTDPISQRIQQGLAAKDKEVEDAYSKATASFSNNKRFIPLTSTKAKMGSLLKNAGYIDKYGKPTPLATNDIAENSPLRKILGYYQSLGANQPGKVSMVNSLQWNNLRNELQAMRGTRQAKALTPYVKSILDSLHSDAERAGMIGIKEARQLAAKNFEAQEKFLGAGDKAKSLFGEKGLDKYHAMTGEQKRSIKDLADFIGDKDLINDIEKTSAGQYLDKIQEGKSLKDFQTLLQHAKDKVWTNSDYNELAKTIGPANAKKVIGEVIAHRKALGIKTAGKVLGGVAATAAVGATGKKLIDSIHP